LRRARRSDWHTCLEIAGGSTNDLATAVVTRHFAPVTVKKLSVSFDAELADVSLVLDAGAVIAYERLHQGVRAFLERAERTETAVLTTTAVVAQVWRDPARQVRLSRLLQGVDEAEITRKRSRSIGFLLRESGQVDIVDGSIVDLAEDGDEILTGEPDDIAALITAAGKTVIIKPIS
jgi:hypothetical protein